MVLPIHPQKLNYFKKRFTSKGYNFEDKLIFRASPEVEKKLLEVHPDDIEEKLIKVGAMEIFRGKVISFYYRPLTLEFLQQFYQFSEDTVSGIKSQGINEGFSRLRTMIDRDNITCIYLVETKIKRFDELTGKKEVFEYGQLLPDRTVFSMVDKHHRKEYRGEPTEVEVKERLICRIPGVRGLEYCLDRVYQPELLPHYLEVEGTSESIFDKGVSRLGLNPSSFIDISVRTLLQKRRIQNVRLPLHHSS